jgi:hypothetical protein
VTEEVLLDDEKNEKVEFNFICFCLQL